MFVSNSCMFFWIKTQLYHQLFSLKYFYSERNVLKYNFKVLYGNNSITTLESIFQDIAYNFIKLSPDCEYCMSPTLLETNTYDL